MALTKRLKELVRRRIASDAEFAEALLREGIDAMLAGDVETGTAIPRDAIKSTSASRSPARRRTRPRKA